MMNGQPAATSAIWVEEPGSVSWTTVSFWTPGPAPSISNVTRDGGSSPPPQAWLVRDDEAARRVGLEDLAGDPDLAAARAQLPRGAGGPVGVDGGAIPVAGREVGLGERAPDRLGRCADERGEDVARGCLSGRRGGVGGRHRVDLQDGLEVGEEVGGADRVAVQPSVVDPADGNRVEVVVALPSHLAACDEVRHLRGRGGAS